MRRVMRFTLLALFGVATVAVQGTLASFLDFETSGPQAVAAGTLALQIDGGEFSVSDLIPGQSGSKTLTVGNTGSLDGTVRLTFEIVSDAETQACTPAESADPDEIDGCTPGIDAGELDHALQVTLTADADGNGTFDQIILGPAVVGALAGVESSGFALPAGSRYPVRLAYRFDDTSSHAEAMTDQLVIDVTGSLENR